MTHGGEMDNFEKSEGSNDLLISFGFIPNASLALIFTTNAKQKVNMENLKHFGVEFQIILFTNFKETYNFKKINQLKG